MPESRPYRTPARSTFWQKLGPGGLASLLLAGGSTVLLLGLPVAWRLRQVMNQSHGDDLEAAEAVPADAIVVLGRRLEGDRPTAVFEARLAHGQLLWQQGRAALVVVAGGITGAASLSEAEAGLAWLRAQGLPADALRGEDRSQHTLENLFHVRELLGASATPSLILVSDPLHLARAGALGRGLGLGIRCAPAPGCPPPRNSLPWWRRALIEAFLLHWYHTGLLYSRVIQSKAQLERVT